MNTETFLKLAEVRQRLGVSRATLWRWTAEQGLKVVRVGGTVRIRESDLEAFLKRHEQGGDGGAEPVSASATGDVAENGA